MGFHQREAARRRRCRLREGRVDDIVLPGVPPYEAPPLVDIQRIAFSPVDTPIVVTEGVHQPRDGGIELHTHHIIGAGEDTEMDIEAAPRAYEQDAFAGSGNDASEPEHREGVDHRLRRAVVGEHVRWDVAVGVDVESRVALVADHVGPREGVPVRRHDLRAQGLVTELRW